VTVPEVPVVFARWEAFVGWLFERTEGFPRRLRPTITVRIENLALDVFEALVDARYDRGRRAALRRINHDLEKLRLLLRLAHTQRALAGRSFHHACEEIDTVGRMVGGWLRHAEGP